MPEDGTAQPVRSSLALPVPVELIMLSLVRYFRIAQPLRSLTYWMSLNVTVVADSNTVIPTQRIDLGISGDPDFPQLSRL